MQVAIDEQALGVKATGVVETSPAHAWDARRRGFHFYAGIRVDPTPVQLEGIVRPLTIPIERPRDAVIVVPVSALSLSTDGTSRVQRRTTVRWNTCR